MTSYRNKDYNCHKYFLLILNMNMFVYVYMHIFRKYLYFYYSSIALLCNLYHIEVIEFISYILVSLTFHHIIQVKDTRKS